MENILSPDPNTLLERSCRAEDHINGPEGRLDYTVTAEYLPLYDDDSQTRALCFCTSYVKKGSSDKKRPVTFAFNGKPGTSSLYLHTACLAPKTLRQTGTGVKMPQPPFVLSDNPHTILDFTDLVFIDPVGTGFSRGSTWKDAERYFGVRQDVAGVAEFIRVWLARYGRGSSPLFVLGESYGGLRGCGLVLKLQDLNILPQGFIAISPALSYGELNTTMLLEHHLVHTLPAMTAAAWYHKKLDGDLLVRPLEDVREEARNWATSDYLTFLWKGCEAGPEECTSCMEKLRRYTGLKNEDIEGMNLRILHRRFAALLLKDQGKVLSIFDSRLTTSGRDYDGTADPHTFSLAAACNAAFFDYFGTRFQFPESHEYFVSNQRIVGAKWDFSSGYEQTSTGTPTRAGGYASLLGDLCKAMRRDPTLKFFTGAGIFDIHCCLDTSRYCISHMDLPEALRENITFKSYWGGHMYYTNPEAHATFREDLKSFYDSAILR